MGNIHIFFYCKHLQLPGPKTQLEPLRSDYWTSSSATTPTTPCWWGTSPPPETRSPCCGGQPRKLSPTRKSNLCTLPKILARLGQKIWSENSWRLLFTPLGLLIYILKLNLITFYNLKWYFVIINKLYNKNNSLKI